MNRRKALINTTAEIIRIESRETMEKINKTKSWYSENKNKIV